MPLYDYECAQCGVVEVLAPSQNSAPVPCPACSRSMRRLMSAPHVNTLSPARRKAYETNERSQHEPRITGGHACCNGGKCQHHATADGDAPRYKTLKGPRRPWMISH